MPDFSSFLQFPLVLCQTPHHPPKPARLRRGQKTGAWAGKTNEYSHEPVETGVTTAALDQIGGRADSA